MCQPNFEGAFLIWSAYAWDICSIFIDDIFSEMSREKSGSQEITMHGNKIFRPILWIAKEPDKEARTLTMLLETN